MKKIVLAALFAVMLASSAFAKPQPIGHTSNADQIYAVDESKAPQSFRGLKFGEDITKVEGMTKVSESTDDPDVVHFYERKGDKLSIGDVELQYIKYVTFKGKLMDVYIDWKEPAWNDEGVRIFSLISATLFNSIGEIPSQFERGASYYWFFKDIQVTLSRMSLGHGLKYFHGPTHALLREHQEQKKRAADAKHEADVERAKNATSDL